MHLFNIPIEATSIFQRFQSRDITLDDIKSCDKAKGKAYLCMQHKIYHLLYLFLLCLYMS